MIETDQLVGSSLSDVGVARSENQDACGEFRNARGERMWIVADGMGGHAGGVKASRMCIEVAGRVFEGAQGTPAELLRDGLVEANAAIHQEAIDHPELYGMGTTAVALIFDPAGTVWLGWVGDSRAYRMRGGRLERLSEDHSIVELWVKMGRITAEEAANHPRRNELSRAIGPAPEVDVDIRSFETAAGDTYVLCSDGLCGYVPDETVAQVISSEEPAAAARRLVDITNHEYDGPDNVTVQVVAVPGGGAFAADDDTLIPGEGPRAMANHSNAGGEESSSSGRGLKIGIVALIVAALLALITWYVMESQKIAREEAERERAEAARIAAEEEAARLEREAAEIAAETARLEARARAAEAARLEAARQAEEERLAAEAREAEIAAQIALAEAALAAEQAAAAEAQRIIDERERILEEQERRRQAELAAAEEARRIEEAFNQARAVDSFVAEWVRALELGDYDLYRELGFRETEDEFRSLYGDSSASYAIAVDERKQWVGGFVSLRVTETFILGSAGDAVSSQATERRVVLRPTSKGMRYAGDRE